MATLTWTGGGTSGTTPVWEDLDWGGTEVPGSQDTAVLNFGSVALDQPVTIDGLEQDGSAVIVGAYDLDISGQASFAGSVVQSGAATTGISGRGTLGAVGSAATLWLDGDRALQLGGSFALVDGQIALGALPGGDASGGGEIGIGYTGTLDISASGTVVTAGSGTTGLGIAGLLRYDGSGEATITASISRLGQD